MATSSNRYGYGRMSGRMDGSQVPGNEPGGANGSYGAYGQSPDIEPPDQPPSSMMGGMARGVGSMALDQMRNSPAGQMYQRYRMPPASGAAMGNTDDPGAPTGMNTTAPPSSGVGGSLASAGRMSTDDPGAPMMRDGGVISKPTLVMLAEHGQPEAVVPLDGHAGSKITPGMMSGARYRSNEMTGPSMVHGPTRPMKPALLDDKMQGGNKSNWSRWNMTH